MFSVYGKSGRLFRGSLEELRKIGPASAMARIHKTFGVGLDGREGSPLDLPPYASDGQHRTATAPPRSVMAATYEDTLKSHAPRHPLKLVRDIMNPGAMTLRDDATVADAWSALTQHQLGQAPVVDARGMLVGLLTRADLMRLDRLPGPRTHALAWQAFLAQRVFDVMWTPVPSVAPETDIRRLARVLIDTGLPGLPVVDEAGVVTGFVSRTDILRALVSDPPLDLWT
jgi:CBS domain-containing protein